MDIWSFIITSIGAILGVAGLIYSIKTNGEKKSLQKLIRSKLKGIAGNIKSIERSATWADKHFNGCREEAQKLADSNSRNTIFKHVYEGARDAEGASRMLENLLNEILSLQEGLFGTRETIHPTLKESDRPEAQPSPQNPSPSPKIP